ncbi:MAG: YidC/Oxa1 family insertase periplasmic-domain containing protein [Planctomycetes bacterium]|nr:YidC/Oxa1 family insertase periplasmic-domain containing protein [Planctomycetota bacterium]
MEKRGLITIVVCTLLFFLWIGVISPWIWPPEKPASPTPQTKPAPQPAPEKPALLAGRVQGGKPTITPEVSKPRELDAVSGMVTLGRYEVAYTSKGGGLDRVLFRTDRGTVPILVPIMPDRPHFAVRVPQAGVPLEQVHWRVSVDREKLQIRFEYAVQDRWLFSKVFTFDEKRCAFRLLIEFRNLHPESLPLELKPEILPFGGIAHDSDYRYEEYCQALVGLRKSDSWSLETISTKDVGYDPAKPKVVQEGRNDWMGLKNRYFAAVFVPAGDRDVKAVEDFRFACLPWNVWKQTGEKRNITTSVPLKPFILGKQAEAFEFTVYLGPIRSQELSEVPRGLSEIYDPSGFNFIAVGILFVLNVGFSLFKNYGIAILFTTIVIRLLLFPLSKKSQVSMYRIQQLGPKLAILRERYKDDRERFGQEQMKLFREQKINPMSGCFPMLLQLPIFIGMYGVLDSAYDLRQTPFYLWIHDLSMPDRLVSFQAGMDLLFFTVDALNLLPIIMTVTWFLQSYFAPRSDDPQMAAQQKMMMFMPVVFGVMCYSLASGLSFYFFVNSLLSMGETKLIKKFFLPKEGSKTP